MIIVNNNLRHFKLFANVPTRKYKVSLYAGVVPLYIMLLIFWIQL